MSAEEKTYACQQCTFVQSINVDQCELCSNVNPNRPPIEQLDFYGDGMATCPRCELITIGQNIQSCEHCSYAFDPSARAPKRLKVEQFQDDEEEEEYEDFPYDDEDDELPAPKSTTDPPATAVEKAMSDEELKSFHQQYIGILQQQRQLTQTWTEAQLHQMMTHLFRSLQYRNDQPDGQLVFSFCQICYDQDEPVITMKACGHRMICPDDFHQYLVCRIRDGDVLPWIPCPAEVCNVPCDAQNIIDDGRLTVPELLSFLTTYMFKKLSRNENFVSCPHCVQGGFLQFGPARKEQVRCPICHVNQTIEKGVDGDLDIAFKQMITSGQLRECPTCRHLTMKEKGLCNVIECAKCGVWWNWRTRQQGHSEKDLKQRARMDGTLWEPGELVYQQNLERSNPAEFKALLERNGIKYNPHYVRGGWGGS